MSNYVLYSVKLQIHLFSAILLTRKGITSFFLGTEELGKQLLYIPHQSLCKKFLRSMWSIHVFCEIKLSSDIIHKISRTKETVNLSLWWWSIPLLKDFTPVAGAFMTLCESKSHCHYLHHVVCGTQMLLPSSQYRLLQKCTCTFNFWSFPF